MDTIRRPKFLAGASQPRQPELPAPPAPEPSPWDLESALALQDAADAAVGLSGVSGTDARIQAAAAECVAAHHRHGLAGVRAACRAIEARVLELTADRPNP